MALNLFFCKGQHSTMSQVIVSLKSRNEKEAQGSSGSIPLDEKTSVMTLETIRKLSRIRETCSNYTSLPLRLILLKRKKAVRYSGVPDLMFGNEFN
ncbi:hypothetical protein BpHYR1_005465 [Brachionus plicatilis]|uniref:Uncharacterized protein n=1 Tax=Brachionus plicatilis TaxID=10195 RepID=A0A3M7S3E0_BRAPC|nr:hypothetical protein BpHYR1_005465 [Brachionus plicatilis]